MEANIILIKCEIAKKVFGARVQKTENNDWVRTWAFEINDKIAINEGYDKTNIQGSLSAVDEYPGCPYCGTKGFFKCGKCGKVNCYNGEEIATCNWCGNTGKLTPVKQFDIKGGGY